MDGDALMRIALDWDNTWTRDPRLWADVVEDFLHYEHDVRIVTMRSEDQIGELHDEMEAMGVSIPIITTNMAQKRPFCEQLGWIPDVWIDDSPEFIVRRD